MQYIVVTYIEDSNPSRSLSAAIALIVVLELIMSKSLLLFDGRRQVR